MIHSPHILLRAASSRWSLVRATTTMVLMMAASKASVAQIALTVQHGTAANDIVLSWTGGTAPYHLYMSQSPDLTVDVIAPALAPSQTSITVNPQGNLVFFNVGDASAPLAWVTNPADGSYVSTGGVTASGTVGAGA